MAKEYYVDHKSLSQMNKGEILKQAGIGAFAGLTGAGAGALVQKGAVLASAVIKGGALLRTAAPFIAASANGAVAGATGAGLNGNSSKKGEMSVGQAAVVGGVLGPLVKGAGVLAEAVGGGSHINVGNGLEVFESPKAGEAAGKNVENGLNVGAAGGIAAGDIQRKRCVETKECQ